MQFASHRFDHRHPDANFTSIYIDIGNVSEFTMVCVYLQLTGFASQVLSLLDSHVLS